MLLKKNNFFSRYNTEVVYYWVFCVIKKIYFWSKIWDTFSSMIHCVYSRSRKPRFFVLGYKDFCLLEMYTFMRGVNRPLLILYISVAKTWRFRLWIKTEPSFSNNSLNDDCLSLYIVPRHLSWSRFMFLLFSRLWHIHINGQ